MRRWRMTFKEAKAEMEKMFPNGVWKLQYSHWLFKSGPKTTCDVYLERTGGATHECDTWQDAIDWVYKKLGQNAAKVQDDPDTEEAANLPSNTHHDDALPPNSECEEEVKLS
jgi:hypothetical protein